MGGFSTNDVDTTVQSPGTPETQPVATGQLTQPATTTPTTLGKLETNTSNVESKVAVDSAQVLNALDRFEQLLVKQEKTLNWKSILEHAALAAVAAFVASVSANVPAADSAGVATISVLAKTLYETFKTVV